MQLYLRKAYLYEVCQLAVHILLYFVATRLSSKTTTIYFSSLKYSNIFVDVERMDKVY